MPKLTEKHASYQATTRATEALFAIDPFPLNYSEWLAISTSYKVAGGTLEEWDNWCKQDTNRYNERENQQTWDSINVQGGIGESTLYYYAKENGWTDTQNTASEVDISAIMPKATTQNTQETVDCRATITEALNNQERAIEYLQSRGLTRDTAERWNIGSIGEWLVIPYPNENYYIKRRMDITPNNSSGNHRYECPKGSSKPLFNSPALNYKQVYVVEGQIDTMSIEQCGQHAIAGDASVIESAIQKRGIEKCKDISFAVIADSDDTGRSKAEKVNRMLQEMGINSAITELPQGYHDVNDYLIHAPEGCMDYLNKQWYKKIDKYSASQLLTQLEECIQAGRKRFSSGFPALDKAIGDGYSQEGFTQGLHIIGGLSSIGKSTFLMQILDFIASQGRDVLIFSVEMSSNEIIAKSLSRSIALNSNKCITTSSILAGNADGSILQQAKKDYLRNIAPHLYICSGLTMNINDIEQMIADFVKVKNSVPIIALDYLQILSPIDSKATDKQNTDKAVLRLKTISTDYETTVFAVSSFNRENYKVAVSEASFKESGAIEYTADVLIGLQFEGAGGEGFSPKACKREVPRRIEAIILKNRNGQIPKDIPFYSYYADRNLFEEKSPHLDDFYPDNKNTI